MDIELDAISDQSSSCVFNRLDMEPENPQMSKRTKKAILTFFAQYYIRIISVMAVVIVLLVCGLILSNLVQFKNEIAHNQHSTQTTVLVSGVNDGRKPSSITNKSTTHDNMGTINSYSVSENDTQGEENSTIDNALSGIAAIGEVMKPTIEKIPCRKFNCGKILEPCILDEVDYYSVKQYSCCGCLEDYRLIRYEELLVARTRSLILAGSKEDPCNMSPLDLLLLNSLKHLKGSWDVNRETNSLCYLRFDITGVDQRRLAESPDKETVITTLEH